MREQTPIPRRNVAFVFFIISAPGVGVLRADMPVWALFAAAAMVGVTPGAEVDLLAYLTSRYFGLRCFSAVFGALFSAILLSMVVGPFIFGLVYDQTHSYSALMVLGVALCVFAMLMVLLPRPYPVWTRHTS